MFPGVMAYDRVLMRSHLYTIIKEQQKIITDSCNEKDIHSALTVTLALVDESCVSSVLNNKFTCVEFDHVRQIFKLELYEKFLIFLLKSLSLEFVKSSLTTQNKLLFENIFLCDADPTSVLFAFSQFLRDNE